MTGSSGPGPMDLRETVDRNRNRTVAAEGRASSETADRHAVPVVWAAGRPLLPKRRRLIRVAPLAAVAQATENVHRIDVDPPEHREAGMPGSDAIGLGTRSLDRPVEPERAADRGAAVCSPADRSTGREAGAGAAASALCRATSIVRRELTLDRAAPALGRRPCRSRGTGWSGTGHRAWPTAWNGSFLRAAGTHTSWTETRSASGSPGISDARSATGSHPPPRGRDGKADDRCRAAAGGSFIAPFRSEPGRVRDRLRAPGGSPERLADTPLAVREARDPQGPGARAPGERHRDRTALQTAGRARRADRYDGRFGGPCGGRGRPGAGLMPGSPPPGARRPAGRPVGCRAARRFGAVR